MKKISIFVSALILTWCVFVCLYTAESAQCNFSLPLAFTYIYTHSSVCVNEMGSTNLPTKLTVNFFVVLSDSKFLSEICNEKLTKSNIFNQQQHDITQTFSLKFYAIQTNTFNNKIHQRILENPRIHFKGKTRHDSIEFKCYILSASIIRTKITMATTYKCAPWQRTREEKKKKTEKADIKKCWRSRLWASTRHWKFHTNIRSSGSG